MTMQTIKKMSRCIKWGFPAKTTVEICTQGMPALGFSLMLPLLLAAPSVNALVEMEEEQMANVTGAGLAFVFDDFSFRMAPTSFVELTGSQPTSDAYNNFGWRRGDARYYGLSMTSAGSSKTNGSGNYFYGTDWYSSNSGGGGCGNSASQGATVTSLSCPMGVGDGDFGVDAFASVYDPFMLRVFEYQGYNYDGGWLDEPAGTPGSSTGIGGKVMPSVLEFRGPANSDPWRWAFWGELEVNRYHATENPTGNPAASGTDNNSVVGSGGADFLQSQTIILGKPISKGDIWDRETDSYSARQEGPRRAVQRWMYTTNTADQTFGVTYDSALSGDFRFSVRQAGGSPDQLHYVPNFNNQEGMYFRNVDAFIPLGTLHYQALTFSGVSRYDENGNELANPVQNGNFSIELTRIPDVSNVYNHFYCKEQGGICDLASDDSIADPNPDTHGYVRWGDWSGVDIGTGAGLPGPNDATNGIYFVGGTNAAVTAPTNTVTNLGISRIEGMLIQHMKITSLGAGN